MTRVAGPVMTGSGCVESGTSAELISLELSVSISILSDEVVVPWTSKESFTNCCANGNPNQPQPKTPMPLFKPQGFYGQYGIVQHKRHGDAVLGTFGDTELVIGQ